MASSGLLKEIAAKTGMTISEIKSKIMRTAIAPYKAFKNKYGHLHVKGYYEYLRHALPLIWKMVRETKTIPTVEEFTRALNEAWPNWEAELEKYLKSKMAVAAAPAA